MVDEYEKVRVEVKDGQVIVSKVSDEMLSKVKRMMKRKKIMYLSVTDFGFFISNIEGAIVVPDEAVKKYLKGEEAEESEEEYSGNNKSKEDRKFDNMYR